MRYYYCCSSVSVASTLALVVLIVVASLVMFTGKKSNILENGHVFHTRTASFAGRGSSTSSVSHGYTNNYNKQFRQRRQIMMNTTNQFDDDKEDEVENDDEPHLHSFEEKEEPLRFSILELNDNNNNYYDTNITTTRNTTTDYDGESFRNETTINASRIIDGTQIPQNRYKYLVALFKKDSATGLLTQNCGGVIVAPRYVLTAAHCLKNTDVVVTGLRDYQRVSPGSYERYDVSNGNFIVHPKHIYETMEYDMALIKLPSRSRFPPIHINFVETTPQRQQKMTVMGWGYLRNQIENSMAFEGTLEHVSLYQCRAKWGQNVIQDSMVCATSPNGNGRGDTCQGDSGGPMIIKGRDDSKDLLVGLTSWGAGCGDPTWPGVYARASAMKKWIQRTIPNLFEINGTPKTWSSSYYN